MTVPARKALLATANPAKQERLRRLLEGLPFECHGPAEAGLLHRGPAQETGTTHAEIAADKAVAWSRAASALAISSDGGLSIPALGDRWQSILTRRLTGEGSDEERAKVLLELMQPCSGQERRATWHEALAIAEDGRLLASWSVQGPTGMVARSPGRRGIPGFWVFDVWEMPSLGKRYSELTERELEAVGDHWAQLKALARPFLEGLIASGQADQ